MVRLRASNCVVSATSRSSTATTVPGARPLRSETARSSASIGVAGGKWWPAVHRLLLHALRFLYPYLRRGELSEGLREIGIKIFKGEQAALMRRLDEDKDGLIAYEELYNALRSV